MDIAGLSMTMANTSLMDKVSTQVLSKALDMNEVLGAGLVQMLDATAMEQSVTPHLGASVDLRV